MVRRRLNLTTYYTLLRYNTRVGPPFSSAFHIMHQKLREHRHARPYPNLHVPSDQDHDEGQALMSNPMCSTWGCSRVLCCIHLEAYSKHLTGLAGYRTYDGLRSLTQASRALALETCLFPGACAICGLRCCGSPVWPSGRKPSWRTYLSASIMVSNQGVIHKATE